MKRTTLPGQPPGPEVLITPSGGGGGGGPAVVLQSRVEVTMNATTEAHVGSVITYTYYLHNTGDLSFYTISVSNDVAGNATYQSGDINVNSILNPNETWVFTSNYTVREGDPSPLVATATISATTSTSVTVVATETATTSISYPGIAILKTACPHQVNEGDDIIYYFLVTNTGDIPLADITMTDDRLGNIDLFIGDCDEDGLLDAGEIWIFGGVCRTTESDPGPLL